MNSNLLVVVFTGLVFHAHVAIAMEPVYQQLPDALDEVDTKDARHNLQEIIVESPNDSLTSSSLSSLTSSSLSSHSSSLSVSSLSISAECKAVMEVTLVNETYVKKLWKKYFCSTSTSPSSLGDLFANRNLVGIVVAYLVDPEEKDEMTCIVDTLENIHHVSDADEIKDATQLELLSKDSELIIGWLTCAYRETMQQLRIVSTEYQIKLIKLAAGKDALSAMKKILAKRKVSTDSEGVNLLINMLDNGHTGAAFLIGTHNRRLLDTADGDGIRADDDYPVCSCADCVMWCARQPACCHRLLCTCCCCKQTCYCPCSNRPCDSTCPRRYKNIIAWGLIGCGFLIVVPLFVLALCRSNLC